MFEKVLNTLKEDLKGTIKHLDKEATIKKALGAIKEDLEAASLKAVQDDSEAWNDVAHKYFFKLIDNVLEK